MYLTKISLTQSCSNLHDISFYKMLWLITYHIHRQKVKYFMLFYVRSNSVKRCWLFFVTLQLFNKRYFFAIKLPSEDGNKTRPSSLVCYLLNYHQLQTDLSAEAAKWSQTQQQKILVQLALAIIRGSAAAELVSWSLTSLLQHKYGYIRDERSGMESYPDPVKEG